MSRKDVAMPLRDFPRSIAAETAVSGSVILNPACLAKAENI